MTKKQLLLKPNNISNINNLTVNNSKKYIHSLIQLFLNSMLLHLKLMLVLWPKYF